MTDFLCRMFIKDYKNTASPEVRGRYGTFASVVGVIVNLLLFVAKFTIGMITASISITAEAVNNLSDAGSSIISFISFKISAKPADREHPYGHARVEYIASMVISFVIMFIGFSLISDSLKKIIYGGEATDPSIAAIVILSLSIAGKLWLYFFNRSLAKKVRSEVMKATAADSLSDALSTTAVLAATLIYRFSGVELDAYMGVLVALFILWSGFGIAREALHSILGTAPDEEFVESIKQIIFSHPEALGIHDLIVHCYGPGRSFVSAHVEVDGAADLYASHDAIDNIEKEVAAKLGVSCTIHLDPVAVGDPLTDELKAKTAEIASSIAPDMDIHDFRIVPGATHTNLIFDVVVPFEVKMSDAEVEEHIAGQIKQISENYFAVITVDRQ